MSSTRRKVAADYVGTRMHKFQIVAVKYKRYPSKTVSRLVCRCDCGAEFIKAIDRIRNKSTFSCGCQPNPLDRPKPTQNTKLYQIWYGMKLRCLNPAHKSYKRYGGRGITIDPVWMNFSQFKTDMEPTYQEGLQLDRKDNNGPYSAKNCHWIPRTINIWKQGKRKGCHHSKYVGVSWDKRHKVWTASIRDNGNKIHLGTFRDEKEAALAYDQKCLELRGQFAQLNQTMFPDDFAVVKPLLSKWHPFQEAA